MRLIKQKFLITMILVISICLFQVSANANQCKNFLSSDSDKWSAISDLSNKNLQNNFQDRYSNFHEAFKLPTNNSKWLALLGFEEYGLYPNGGFRTPNLEQIISRYNSLIDRQVKKFNESVSPDQQILEEEVIRIGFEFINDQNSVVFLSYGDPIPFGYYHSDRFTPGQKLYRSLSQGLFPMAIGSLQFHDLAHLTGYLDNPEYMAAYKRLVTNVNDNFNGLIMHKKPGVYSRLQYFNESLVLVDPDEVLRNIYVFSIPESGEPPYGKRSYTAKQIRGELEKMEIEDLVSKANAFLELPGDLIIELGGAARDGVNGVKYSQDYNVLRYLNLKVRDTLITLNRHLNQDLNDPNIKRRLKRDQAELVKSLSILQSSILILSELNPTYWGQYIYQEKFSSSSISLFFSQLFKDDSLFDYLDYTRKTRFHSSKKW